MRTTLFSLGFLISIVGSLYIIYSNHYVVNGYSSYGLIFLIMVVPVSFVSLFFISKFCLEIAYRANSKNLRVKTFRRPKIATIFVFGLIFGLAYFSWRFTLYIETSAQSMAETFFTMLFPIGIGGIVSLGSTFLEY